ncbi:glutamyl-tRNA reductase [Rapidithrix thailandica]|uniref:Glutamyl-tRNA reductase n=1 Tax=Rapidithrix thailandica TaxID=413964 RepID=A0AAW9RTW1_9BACT
MQGQFKAISVSYKTTPIHIREHLSLSQEECERLLEKLKDVLNLNEALILSTCNRTEIYYSSEEDHSDWLIKLLGIEKKMGDVADLEKYFIRIKEHEMAIRHLFRVAMGLESQVVGDLQISNQVKKAYQWSADAEMAGPFLHRLMHTIFFTNKRVVQETPFRDGAASTSYAGVELLQELTTDVKEPKVLVVGLGEIGTDVVRNLADSTLGQVKITNRTLSKAQALAATCGFEAVPFEKVWEEAREAHVIISSISKSTPFFTKSKVEEVSSLAFKCFIDLSVPRSVEKEVEDVPGVLVYNIDNIQNRASQALKRRMQSVPQVEQIVEEAIAEFREWTREMVFSPTIQKLKGALEDIRQEELKKAMKQMDDAQFKKVDKLTRNMMNKILRIPVLQLKAACKRDEAETLVDVLNDLFNLENQENKVTK